MIFPSKYFIAIEAAVEASALIMKFYNDGFNAEIKPDGSPVTEADLASSKLILQRLQETNLPIMDEESKAANYELRKNWDQYWCVDPLDGTTEYIKRNGEFAVNIALIENQKPVFGVIASPVNREIIFGGGEFGSFYCSFEDFQKENKWRKLSPSGETNFPLVMISSRSHFSGISLDFVNELKAVFGEVNFITKGSALKFFDLALNRADVYPRFAPTMEWDIAAGQAILEALGGKVVHAQTGNPLVYNKKNLLNPHFVAASRPYILKKENN